MTAAEPTDGERIARLTEELDHAMKSCDAWRRDYTELQNAIKARVAEEREACAKACEDDMLVEPDGFSMRYNSVVRSCSAAIRARATAQGDVGDRG